MRNPSSSSASSTSKTTPCCAKVGIKRGPWTPEEDEILANYVKKEGEGRWRTLPKRAGLLRCGKSCRLRWMNYLRPSVKRGKIAPDEEDLILRLHRLLGNRWSLIAGRIPGRTDNEIKNYWNTHLSKKLISQGIDPRTHKPLILNPSPNYEIEANDVASTSNRNNKPHSNSSDIKETRIESQSMFAADHQMNTNIKGAVRLPAADRCEVFGHIGAEDGNIHQSWQNPYIISEELMTMEAPQNKNDYAHNDQDLNGQYYIENSDEDAFSSFLDSLINDDVYPNQQQRPNLISTPAAFPLFSPTLNFGHGAFLWENETRSTRDNVADHHQRQSNKFA